MVCQIDVDLRGKATGRYIVGPSTQAQQFGLLAVGYADPIAFRLIAVARPGRDDELVRYPCVASADGRVWDPADTLTEPVVVWDGNVNNAVPNSRLLIDDGGAWLEIRDAVESAEIVLLHPRPHRLRAEL